MEWWNGKDVWRIPVCSEKVSKQHSLYSSISYKGRLIIMYGTFRNFWDRSHISNLKNLDTVFFKILSLGSYMLFGNISGSRHSQIYTMQFLKPYCILE
jgi:hypothetical protein